MMTARTTPPDTHNLGPCTLHNPHYDFNDDLIPLGGTLWIRLVDKWFRGAPALLPSLPPEGALG